MELVSQDGALIDRSADLAWTPCPSGQQLQRGKCKGAPLLVPWELARAFCAELVLAGGSDWRLPTLEESTRALPHTPRGATAREWTRGHAAPRPGVPGSATAIDPGTLQGVELKDGAEATVRCVRVVL